MLPTICLAMIVKDEAAVLARCLESVRPYLTSWVICDTGSTDATELVIAATLADLPGIIYHDAWVDFGYNRSLAMTRARETGADYIVVIDADQWLVVDDPHAFEQLVADVYAIRHVSNDVEYPHPVLFSTRLDWRYEGVLHEYPTADQPYSAVLMHNVTVLTGHDGGSYADPEKGQKRIDLLEAELAKDPSNARNWYFLAQEYWNVDNAARAIACYEIRAQMPGGNPDEIWYSIYKIGWLSMITGDWDEAIQSFQEAQLADPHRAEPWFWQGVGHVARNELEDALGPLKIAAGLPKPAAGHLIQSAVYDYAALVNYAVVSAKLGRIDQAGMLARQALALPDLPIEQREGLERLLVEAGKPEDSGK